MANARRRNVPEGLRYKILRETQFMCIYCGGDANEVDHIIPYSYSQNNDESNLVPACGVCNRLASNKVFDSLAHKMLFIQQRRKAKNLFPVISGIKIPVAEDARFPEHKLFSTIEEVKAHFIALFKDFSYNEIALTYDINKGVVWKIIKSDYEPKKNKIRGSLGLPFRSIKPQRKPKMRTYKPRSPSPSITHIDPSPAIQVIQSFVDKEGGINKGCKLVSKRLRGNWTWKYIYHIYAGRVVPGNKVLKKIKALRPPKPKRKRHRIRVQAKSKEQWDNWQTLTMEERRNALDQATNSKYDRLTPLPHRPTTRGGG